MKEYYQKIHGKKHQDCNFGHTHFNLKKKDVVESTEQAPANRPTKGKGHNGGSNPPPTPPPSSTNGCILLDFTGHTVTGTSWNYNGDIVCTPANLTSAQVDEVLNTVINDYKDFNVVITTDESVFNTYSIGKRTRVIFTETWEWYGQSGGTSFVGSFYDGSDSPCFVFTSLLGYNTREIRAAGSHEAGHTLGLYHQSSYDANCIKTNEYNHGDGINSPIMGYPYSLPDIWWIGANSYGCNNIQHDHDKISSVLGLK